MSSGGGSRERRITRASVFTPVASVVAVAVGVGLVAWVQTASYSFGWFAYAPLSGTVFAPSFGVPSPSGVVLVVLGIVLLAFWFGARRSTRLLVALAGLCIVGGAALIGGGLVPTGEAFTWSVAGFGSVEPTDFAFVGGAVLSLPAATTWYVVGMLLAAAGIVTLAFWSGRRLANRSSGAGQADSFARSA